MIDRAPDRIFRETPIFSNLAATSFSFAFELAFRDGEDEEPERVAFRLSAIVAALEEDDKARAAEAPDVFGKLIQPVRSFLDDVTSGPPGTNGRPLIVAAAGDDADDSSREIWLVRPSSWEYEFEGMSTALHVPEGRRHCPLRLRDSFCVFESGRLFYILTLTQPSEGAAPLDEYAVIQLQQLSLDAAEYAHQSGYLGFARRHEDIGTPLSLIGLAEARLGDLESGAVPKPNGVADVLVKYGLVDPADKRCAVAPDQLRRLCIGIESDEMLGTAKRAYQLFAAPEKSAADVGVAAPPDAPDLEILRTLAALDEEWRGRHRAADVHRDPDNNYDRTLLSFAGIATGVPDFPYQDESEVHDSTRPTFRSVESSLYTHPRFTLEVAKKWRSFNAARPCIGTCPYLLLMFMVTLHDELIVADMEKELEKMIYELETPGGPKPRPSPVPAKPPTRVRPMADVRKVLLTARNFTGGNVHVLARNLHRRLELFRWTTIHRSGNIFRYAKERGALEAIQKAMGTIERFDRAHATVDRMESLIEDVSNLKSSYAERRTNTLLLVLALMGLLGLPKVLHELRDESWNNPELVAIMVAFGLGLLLMFIWDRFFGESAIPIRKGGRGRPRK